MNNWRFTLTVIAATTAIIGTAQAVTDTAFKYSTAKTGYFTINPGDLIPNSSDATYGDKARWVMFTTVLVLNAELNQ